MCGKALLGLDVKFTLLKAKQNLIVQHCLERKAAVVNTYLNKSKLQRFWICFWTGKSYRAEDRDYLHVGDCGYWQFYHAKQTLKALVQQECQHRRLVNDLLTTASFSSDGTINVSAADFSTVKYYYTIDIIHQ